MLDKSEFDSNTPLVSVVMPLFNKAFYVKNAIESVLSQSYLKIELIVVNDGSTDNSLHIAENIEDSRLKIINQTNAGVSNARNRGVRASSGELIAFIDADDLWFRDHISVLVNAHKKYTSAGIICNQFVHSRDKWVQNDCPKYTLIHNYVCEAARGERQLWTSALIIRRDIFEETGAFPPDQSHGEDMAVWIKASLISPVVFSDYMGAYYRKTENGLTSHLVNYPDGGIEAINNALSSQILSKCNQKCLMKYRTRIALAHIITACRHRNRQVALQFLEVAQAYPIKEIRYYMLLIIAYLPARVSGFLVNIFMYIRAL